MTILERILDILNEENVNDYSSIVEFIEEAIAENSFGDSAKMEALELFFDRYTDDIDGNPFEQAGYDELIAIYENI